MPSDSASISFISFIASTMQSTWPLRTACPTSTNERRLRRRRAVERADERRADEVTARVAAGSTGGGGVSAIGRGPATSRRRLDGTAAAAAHAHVPAAVGLDLGQVELGGDARQLAHGFEVDAAAVARRAVARRARRHGLELTTCAFAVLLAHGQARPFLTSEVRAQRRRGHSHQVSGLADAAGRQHRAGEEVLVRQHAHDQRQRSRRAA